MPPTKRKTEAPLLADIRLAIGLRTDVMACRVNAGVFKPLHGNQNRGIRSAPNGFPDLLVVQSRTVPVKETVNPDGFQPLERHVPMTFGQAIAVETKSARGTQRKAQVQFQAAWEAVGGTYILARSVQDVLDVIGLDE
jgi:hypothetical protein